MLPAPSAKGGGSSHSSDADSEGESASSGDLPALVDPPTSAEGESAGEESDASSGPPDFTLSSSDSEASKGSKRRGKRSKDKAEALKEVEAKMVRRNLQEEALSLDHMMDHSKFNLSVEARAQRKGKRKGALVVEGECPDEFGIQCTGDHMINKRKDNFVAQLYKEDSEFPSATTAVVFYDRNTKWHACCPKATKTTEDTV